MLEAAANPEISAFHGADVPVPWVVTAFLCDRQSNIYGCGQNSPKTGDEYQYFEWRVVWNGWKNPFTIEKAVLEMFVQIV